MNSAGSSVGPSRRLRASRRARVALAWMLGVFVAVQAALLVAMETTRPELRLPEYGYRVKQLRKRLAAEPERPLALVLGSSRTELGFCPDVLPAFRAPDGSRPLVFNFGISSSGPVEELLYLHRLLHAGIRPRWVLIELLPSGLSYGPAGLDEYVAPTAKGMQLAWSDLPVLSRHCRRPWGPYASWASSRSVPGFTHRFHVMDRVAPAWLPLTLRQELVRTCQDASGWVCWLRSVTPAEYERGLASARGLYYDALQQFRVCDAPDRVLRELFALCRREGIRPALFLMPEGSDFQTWYTPEGRAALDGYLTRLGVEEELPILDGRNWVADGHFMDGHHLLPEGAAQFSRRLGVEALGPLLADDLPPGYRTTTRTSP